MSVGLLPPLQVVGHGFFGTHHAEASHVATQVLLETPQKPKFALLVARARRFTSLVTQMQVEVCEQALQALPAQSRCHSVFCSSNGEVQTAADLIADLQAMQSVSSARFALSVHNTPSGLLSIATANTNATTTISNGESSLAAGLLEAFLTVQERHTHLLLSYADEAIPTVFGGPTDSQLQYGIATSFLLQQTSANNQTSLGTLTLREVPLGNGAERMESITTSAAALSAAISQRQSASVAVGSLRNNFTLIADFVPAPQPL